MTTKNEQNIVLINKCDKKIVIKRKSAAVSSPAVEVLPEEGHVADRNVEAQGENVTVEQKLSGLQRLKALNFSAPKTDVNIFAVSSPKRAKLDEKPKPQQQQRKEPPSRTSLLSHDRPNWQQKSTEQVSRSFGSERRESFPPAREERFRDRREESRTSSVHRFGREERFTSLKSSETAAPSFTYEQLFGSDSDQTRRRDFASSSIDDRPHRAFPPPPSMSRRGGGGGEFRRPPLSNFRSQRFARDFGHERRRDDDAKFESPVAQQPPSFLDQSPFRVGSAINERFDMTPREKPAFRRDFPSDEPAFEVVPKNFLDRRPHPPIIPLMDRLEEEKLENLAIDPSDLKRLSLLGLKNTVEYLSELNKDLHYQTTRLANQIAHTKSALACCPKRNLTESELEALVSKNVENEDEDATKEDTTDLPFHSTICEETFASALCKSIYDQAEERRRALVAGQKSYAAVEPLESKRDIYLQTMQSFFSGLASGMVEKIKYDESSSAKLV